MRPSSAIVATSPLADSRSLTKAFVFAATFGLEKTTIMPLPIAAGVLGMQRITAASGPSISVKVAIDVPAAMLRKVAWPAKRL